MKINFGKAYVYQCSNSAGVSGEHLFCEDD